MRAVFLVFMFVFGAIFGSFACCQTRRLHRLETGKKSLGKRSVCEACGRKLSWAENIPIFSWLALRGRCKKCKSKIGATEIWSEIGLGLAFLGLGWKFWPELESGATLEYVKLGVMMAIFTGLMVLLIYDALWKKLPTRILYGLAIAGGIYFGLELASGARLNWLSFLAGVGVLPGVYFLLYFLSGERLVGSGDWLLALPIALILQDFWLCLLVLFSSNFLACLIMIPVAVRKKQKKTLQIPFGPFLVIAFWVVYLASELFVEVGIII